MILDAANPQTLRGGRPPGPPQGPAAAAEECGAADAGAAPPEQLQEEPSGRSPPVAAAAAEVTGDGAAVSPAPVREEDVGSQHIEPDLDLPQPPAEPTSPASTSGAPPVGWSATGPADPASKAEEPLSAEEEEDAALLPQGRPQSMVTPSGLCLYASCTHDPT